MKQAVILAAGKGLRMEHLTKDTPKPLIEINNKPFIVYLLDKLEHANYKKVIIVVGYLKEKIIEYFTNHNYSFELIFVDQGEPLGTGHAVKSVRDIVEGEFVVINGDDIYPFSALNDMPFNDNFNYVFACEHEEPQRFGTLVLDGNYLIEIEEKPENPKTNLINAGLYKFTNEVFDVLDTIEKSPRGEYEITSAIAILANQKKVKAKVLDYWQPLGKLEDVPIVEDFLRVHKE